MRPKFYSHPKKSLLTKLSVFVLLITLLTGLMPQFVLAYPDDYVTTETEISEDRTTENVESVRSFASSLWSSNQKDDYTTGHFSWDTEDKDRSWTYYNGIMMDAFLMLDSNTYIAYVNNFYDENINDDGNVNNSTSENNKYKENELDSIPPTRALFDLIRDTSGVVEDSQKTKYRTMISNVYSIMENFSTIEGANNNFYHKTNNDNWNTHQIALDGLYMAQPFFMELANALDDQTLSTDQITSSPDSNQLYQDVYNRMYWIGENLYDEYTGLYCHGWGKDGVGVNGQYWLRAVGWYAAALADVISMFPDECIEYKLELINIEKRLFDGMLEYQDPVTGMWYNVINYDSGLATASQRNELESSGSALMAYAMMKSYVEGYVDDTYGEAGLRAFNGTAMNFLDSYGFHNVYKSSGVATTPEGYLTSTYETNEAKGVGPFLMAASYAEDAAYIHSHPLVTVSWTETGLTVPVNTAPDFSGVTLLLEFSNGTSLELDSDKLTFGEYDSSTAGTQNVEVYYKGVNYADIEVTFVETVAEPTFTTRSLSLGGELGVNFFMDLPGDIANYENSYMTFTYNGKEATAYFNKKFMNVDKKYYGFTCLVNSLQMAETITAVFHYGENNDKTVETTYSVLEYLNILKDPQNNYDEELVDLANAISDYGYYAQVFSAQLYKYDISDRYQPMPNPTASDFDYQAIANKISDFRIVPLSHTTGIENLTYAINLGSRTDIRIYLKMKEDYTDEPYVEIDSNQTSAKLQADERYMIEITDIPANKLSEMHKVTFVADGDDSIKVSALSYVYSVLKSDGQTNEMYNAMAAFANYYLATMNYLQSQSE